MRRALLLLLWWPRCCAALPLASTLRKAVGSSDIELVWQAASVAQADEDGEYVQHRSFGSGKNATVGHTVIYLHHHFELADKALRTRLQELVPKLVKAAGWRQAHLPLKIRCIEVIRYEGSGHKDENIGWHTDGATTLTVAVMLSNAADFRGGGVNLRSEDDGPDERYALDVGDALAWRGWTEHQVEPVVSGHRNVLVVEWWSGEDATVSGYPRDKDQAPILREAVKIDPASSQLRRLLGQSLCRRLPCKDPAFEEEAQLAYREALRLQPDNAWAHRSLGTLLLGRAHSWIEGLKHIRRWCLLDPDRRYSAFYCPLSSLHVAMLETFRHSAKEAEPSQSDDDLDVELQDASIKIYDQLWQAALVVMVLAVLIPAVWWLEKQDRSMAKKVT